MNKTLSACTLFLINQIAVANGPVIDVPKIAGQSKAAISARLGQPSACEPGKYGEKCRYDQAGVEIVFIRGKADWITIKAVAGLPYSQEIIENLGFKPTPPTLSNQNTIRWQNLTGFLEVAIFPGPSGKIEYAYIKTKTP